MPEFGDFGERTPEEIEFLESAMESLGGARFTINQLDHFLENRSAPLDDNADDIERRDYYVLQDPRFETVIKQEYDLLLVAVEAVAKYRMAEKNTQDVRSAVEREASRLLIAANQIASSVELSAEDFISKD